MCYLSPKILEVIEANEGHLVSYRFYGFLIKWEIYQISFNVTELLLGEKKDTTTQALKDPTREKSINKIHTHTKKGGKKNGSGESKRRRGGHKF